MSAETSFSSVEFLKGFGNVETTATPLIYRTPGGTRRRLTAQDWREFFQSRDRLLSQIQTGALVALRHPENGPKEKLDLKNVQRRISYGERKNAALLSLSQTTEALYQANHPTLWRRMKGFWGGEKPQVEVTSEQLNLLRQAKQNWLANVLAENNLDRLQQIKNKRVPLLDLPAQNYAQFLLTEKITYLQKAQQASLVDRAKGLIPDWNALGQTISRARAIGVLPAVLHLF